MPIYENLVIGNFLYALGLKVGARHGVLAPDLAVHLTQQTPLDIVLGDVLLVGPRSVALLEFKRAANWEGRWKEQSKLLKIEAFLNDPEFQVLRDTSRQIHFYVETEDTLNDEDFGRVLPYLDLRRNDRRRNLGQLIEDLVSHASSAPMRIEACQLYLNLVCSSQGYSYHASPGLLVGVGADGGIAFAPVDDIRDLRTTLAAIHLHQITLAREQLRQERRQREDLRQRQSPRLVQR